LVRDTSHGIIGAKSKNLNIVLQEVLATGRLLRVHDTGIGLTLIFSFKGVDGGLWQEVTTSLPVITSSTSAVSSTPGVGVGVLNTLLISLTSHGSVFTGDKVELTISLVDELLTANRLSRVDDLRSGALSGTGGDVDTTWSTMVGGVDLDHVGTTKNKEINWELNDTLVGSTATTIGVGTSLVSVIIDIQIDAIEVDFVEVVINPDRNGHAGWNCRSKRNERAEGTAR